MYYPFLRGRQFELISLRELATEELTQGLVCPIIEPVKESYNNLQLAVQLFHQKEQKIYFVVNPLVGEMPGDSVYFLTLLKQFDKPNLYTAFHYRNNFEYIIQNILDFHLKDCLIICPADTTIDDAKIVDLLSKPEVSSICVTAPGRNRSLHRHIRGLKKDYIRLDDLFEKQLSNSAYLEISEHRFSEEHLYYLEEGFTGFGDYTVLPSEYTDGGSTPRAVVIHLTYKKADNEIWIRHFTSESNDSIANVQGKFAEAANKAVSFCRLNNLSNSAISELISYFDQQHYPGLGTIKKISIKNHIAVVAEYLRNRQK